MAIVGAEKCLESSKEAVELINTGYSNQSKTSVENGGNLNSLWKHKHTSAKTIHLFENYTYVSCQVDEFYNALTKRMCMGGRRDLF